MPPLPAGPRGPSGPGPPSQENAQRQVLENNSGVVFFLMFSQWLGPAVSTYQLKRVEDICSL